MTRWIMLFNVNASTNHIYSLTLFFTLFLISVFSKDIQGGKICPQGKLV